MFEAGQTVSYSTYGICRVEEKTLRQFGKEMVEYYVLKPVMQDSATLYVPTGNQKLVSRMQRLLTEQEICDIICNMEEETMWIAEDAKRRECYMEILHSGDRAGMARIIRTLFLRQQELAFKRKKLHIADEKILKEAERVLYEEFAYVLGIEQGKVRDYIAEQIRAAQREVNEG